MNYLISAANSDIAISMARILKQEKKDAIIIGIAPDGLYPASSYFDKVESIPYADDVNYIHSLAKKIKKHEVDIFVPVSEAELCFFLKNKELITSFSKTKILINDPFLLEKCLDKYATFVWLSSIEVNVPETCLFNESYQSDFPAIIKQRRGAGSKNIVIPKTKDLYLAIKKEYELFLVESDYVIQRCIGDISNEYTCAIWRCNNIFRHLVLRRKMEGGTTVQAIVEEHDSIKALLVKISKNINFDFFLNVQIRFDKKKPYIFEINPRFSGTIMMRHMLGFKDFKWMLDWLELGQISTYTTPSNNSQVFKTSQEIVYMPN